MDKAFPFLKQLPMSPIAMTIFLSTVFTCKKCCVQRFTAIFYNIFLPGLCLRSKSKMAENKDAVLLKKPTCNTIGHLSPFFATGKGWGGGWDIKPQSMALETGCGI